MFLFRPGRAIWRDRIHGVRVQGSVFRRFYFSLTGSKGALSSPETREGFYGCGDASFFFVNAFLEFPIYFFIVKQHKSDAEAAPRNRLGAIVV